jgi:sporulation protein YlmC with PRC-barrel domain
MKTLHDVKTWKGAKMVDRDGDKIGTIEDIYLDRHTGEPAWATVKTGLFGTKVSFVPISDAGSAGEGEVRVNLEKGQVKDAPSVDPDGLLTADEERRLYEHYGRSDYGEWAGEDRTQPRFDRTGDDAMTRSQEHVRLRKYVVTKDVGPEGDF